MKASSYLTGTNIFLFYIYSIERRIVEHFHNLHKFICRARRRRTIFLLSSNNFKITWEKAIQIIIVER
jgi:hypothetical protein